MKLGVYIHGSSPFKPKESVDEYYNLARTYENLGIDSLWFADHLIRTPDPIQQPLHETWTLLTAIATKTSKIRLGTMVTPITFRDLGYFAKMITTIDHISKGRVIAGLGTGWYGREHHIFGIPFPPLKERFLLLEESLDLLIKLWTQEKVTSPEHYRIQLKSAYLNPNSYTKPHPPILIGGSGKKKTLRLVAQYGDMANFGGNLGTISKTVEILKKHCKTQGRDISSIVVTTNMAIILGDNDREVEAGITNYLSRFTELGMQAPAKETFTNNRLVGTPEQVVEQIKRLEEIGIGMVNLTINDNRSEELLPNFCKLIK